MATLFLLGNGFDISCGIKCSYQDIYQQYVLTDSKSKAIAGMKKDIVFNVSSWGDFEMGLAKYAECLEDDKQLRECVRDMKAFLQEYLSTQQELFANKCSKEQYIIRELMQKKVPVTMNKL